MSIEISSANRLPVLPPGTVSSTRRKKNKRVPGYYKRRATAIYELRMREYIAKCRTQGRTVKSLAAELQVNEQTVRNYWHAALARVMNLVPYDPLGERFDEDLPRRERVRRKKKSPTSNEGDPHSPLLEGEVLDAPDDIILRKEVLTLMQAALPFDAIGDRLGISEREANRYGKEALEALEKSELLTMDNHRRLMVMQIDQMIAAVHAPATGTLPNGQKAPPVLEAIDRMAKLLKQKADLMGLSNPQVEDIYSMLYRIAEESKYDLDEVEQIAREVLQNHRIKLPGTRPPVR